MQKKRTIKTEEIYAVCDLCGEEIDQCNGNSIRVGDTSYDVHMMVTDIQTVGSGVNVKVISSTIPCGIKLIADTIKAKK